MAFPRSSSVPSVATQSQQNWRLEANQRERERMVTYSSTNTKRARPNVNELPRTDLQWLAAPFPSRRAALRPPRGLDEAEKPAKAKDSFRRAKRAVSRRWS